MAAWPASLPEYPLADSLQETAPDLVLRTQMDAGPAKVRKRFTAAPVQLAMRFELTKAQVATLLSFYETDADGGATTHTMTHPRTSATVTVRFVGQPQVRSISADIWQADVQVEILP